MTPDQEKLYLELNPLQQAVANSWIASGIDATYADAYTLGCLTVGKELAKNPRQSGYEILIRPDVKAYIDSVVNPAAIEAANGAIASREEILEFYTNVLRTPAMTEIPDPDKMTKAQTASFAGLRHTKYGMNILQHDPMAAAKAIAEMNGLKVAPKAPVDKDGNAVGAPTVIVDPDIYKAARDKVLDDDI